MNHKITEMKNKLKEINSRITKTEEFLRDKIVEMTAKEQNRGEKK